MVALGDARGGEPPSRVAARGDEAVGGGTRVGEERGIAGRAMGGEREVGVVEWIGAGEATRSLGGRARVELEPPSEAAVGGGGDVLTARTSVAARSESAGSPSAAPQRASA